MGRLVNIRCDKCGGAGCDKCSGSGRVEKDFGVIGRFLCFVGLHKYERVRTRSGKYYEKIWEKCVRCGKL